MAYLIYQLDSGHKEAIPIANEEQGFRIGRHPENNLVIQEDSSTSRHHCIIRRPDRNSHFLLEDLGSSNGTQVNDERVWATSVKLCDGDRLLVGNAELIFQIEPHDYDVTSSTSIIVKPEQSPPPSSAALPVPASPPAEPSVIDTVQLDRNRDLPAIGRLAPRHEQPPPLTLEPSVVINGYEIIRPLGSGQFSTVYLANQTTLRRIVAMKTFPVDLTRNALLDGFISSIQAAGRIQHPNVVSCLDTGSCANFCYFTMAYVPEGSVATRLAENGPFEEAEAKEIIVRLSYAIEHAQSKYRLIHYNLRPTNILFAEHGEPVIVDYGLAEWLATYLQVNRKSFFGNPLYMCAEQVLDRGPDWTCDIYALGIVFYEMLCGRPPFEGGTPYQIIEKHMHKPVAFPKNVNISEPTQATIRKMLAKKAEARYPNWQALIRELEVRKAAPGKQVLDPAIGVRKFEMTKSQTKLPKFTVTSTKSIKLPDNIKKPAPLKIFRKQ